MKKILVLLAAIAAAVAGTAVLARRRSQDFGEFAGVWAERAEQVAASASIALPDDAIDLRDEVPAAERI